MRDAALTPGKHRLARPITFSIATSAAAGLLLVGIGFLTIEPVFGPAFAMAPWLLLPMVVAEVCFAPYVVASRGLLGRGWTRTAGMLGLAASLLALCCYTIGASWDGSFGLAIGCIVLYLTLSLISCTLFVYKSRRLTDIVANQSGSEQFRVLAGPLPNIPGDSGHSDCGPKRSAPAEERGDQR